MAGKQKKILIVIALILSYVGYMVYSQVSYNKIEIYGRYTVAAVTDFKTNFRNGYTVYYEYRVSDVLYEESMHVSQNYENIIRYRFFAKFNPKQPKHCAILLDKPAPSKYWEAVPSDGWDKIPK